MHLIRNPFTQWHCQKEVKQLKNGQYSGRLPVCMFLHSLDFIDSLHIRPENVDTMMRENNE